MDLLSGDYNASVIGQLLILTGVITGLLNLLIARVLSENTRRGFIVGLGIGLFLSPVAPLFLLFRACTLITRKQHV